MAMVPLFDYRIFTLENLEDARTFSDILVTQSRDEAAHREREIETFGDTLMKDFGSQTTLVINWSGTYPTEPSLVVMNVHGGLEFKAEELHRGAVPFLVADIARDAGIDFDGTVNRLVDVLKSGTWMSICRDISLLHYASMLADYYNLTTSKKEDA